MDNFGNEDNNKTIKIIIAIFVIIIPLIFSFYTSFTSYKLTRPDSLFYFVGFRNYERLIDNTKFWYAFGRTILFLAVVLNLELLFGQINIYDFNDYFLFINFSLFWT